MSKDERPIEAGDRFRSKDKRDGGRVVEIHQEPFAEGGKYQVRTVVAPVSPSAVGGRSWVSERTLRTRYERVSH